MPVRGRKNTYRVNEVPEGNNLWKCISENIMD
jgi:hypothetical protein